MKITFRIPSKIPTKRALQDRVESIQKEVSTFPKDIQWIMRKDKIFKSGSKAELAEAIDRYEKRVRAATKIQSHCRKRFVQRLYKMANWRLHHSLHNCVNASDFYTLEPLRQIAKPFVIFFENPNSPQFYGFHIGSLIAMMNKQERRRRVCMNPYTRDSIDVQHVLRIYKSICIVFPQLVAANRDEFPEYQGRRNYRWVRRDPSVTDVDNGMQPIVQPHYNPVPMIRRASENSFLQSILLDDAFSQEFVLYPTPDLETNPMLTTEHSLNALLRLPHRSDRFYESATKLLQMESLHIHTRVVELFMEFDQLGNYTLHQWFDNLTWWRLRRFFRTMRQRWDALQEDVRQSICVLGDPFELVITHRMTEQEMRIVCISGMERMTYCGETTEDRKLGVFQILCALCEVSLEARRGLPHLAP